MLMVLCFRTYASPPPVKPSNLNIEKDGYNILVNLKYEKYR